MYGKRLTEFNWLQIELNVMELIVNIWWCDFLDLVSMPGELYEYLIKKFCKIILLFINPFKIILN